jgi:hypothetical protein
MGISLSTREASRDKTRMDDRIRKLGQNRANISVTNLLNHARDLIPSQWPLNQLKPVNPREGQICVFDFPFEWKFDSKELAASVRTFPLVRLSSFTLTNAYYSALPKMPHIE